MFDNIKRSLRACFNWYIGTKLNIVRVMMMVFQLYVIVGFNLYFLPILSALMKIGGFSLFILLSPAAILIFLFVSFELFLMPMKLEGRILTKSKSHFFKYAVMFLLMVASWLLLSLVMYQVQLVLVGNV